MLRWADNNLLDLKWEEIGEHYGRYRLHVPEAERDWLYPCASLLRAGVQVAAGSDAPFGPQNPWLAIGGQLYLKDPQGYVMPIQKNQPPPDPKYFQKYWPAKK